MTEPHSPELPLADPSAHMTHMEDSGPLVWPAWLFMVIVIATVAEVVARYLLEAPTLWANELSLFVCGITFLCAGIYVMSRGEHLRITILYDASPGWLRRIFDAINLACTLCFCIALAWFGFPTSWSALMNWERFGTAWNPPIPAVLKPMIVVAAVLMAIFAVRNFLRGRYARSNTDSGTL